MSMTLCLVKAALPLAARLRLDPHLLEQLWEWEAPVPGRPDRRRRDPAVTEIDRERDTLAEDLLAVSRDVYEGSTAYPWMTKVLEGTGSTIGYNGGYEDAYVVGPQEVAAIADGLVTEGWWVQGQEVQWVPQAIAAFYRAAADEGRYVIGVVT